MRALIVLALIAACGCQSHHETTAEWCARMDKESIADGCVVLDDWHMQGNNGPIKVWVCGGKKNLKSALAGSK